MTFLLALLLLVGNVHADAAPGGSAPPDGALQDSTFAVMTFNIRYDNPDDAPNDWPARRDTVAKILAAADLFGVQEAKSNQMTDLQVRLPGFDWFGVGRADGQSDGEFSAIFYREDRFELLDHDTFWLSETPDVVGSVGWDAALERIATWGRLRDRATGHTLYYFNTHFDHRGEQARRESACLLLRKIGEIAGDAPVVLTGDFNAVDSSQVYQILTGAAADVDSGQALEDARGQSAQAPVGPNSTWEGFEEIVPGRRIDFVFTRGAVRVLRHVTLADTIPGTDRFPSDHLPVRAEMEIAE